MKFYCLKNSLPYNILFMPKQRKSIFIDKIMAGVLEEIYDWSDKVNMHLIRSYSQYLDSIQ